MTINLSTASRFLILAVVIPIITMSCATSTTAIQTDGEAVGPSAAYHYMLAEEAQWDNVDYALEQLELSIEADPRFVLAYFKRAMILMDNGDERGARKDLEAIARIDSGFAPALVKLIHLEKWSDNYDSAMSYAEALIHALPEDPDGYREKGWLLMERDRKNEGLESFRIALEVAPPNKRTQVLVDLGYALKENDALKEAEEVLWEAVDGRPQDSDAYYSLGWLLFETGRMETGLEVLDLGVEHSWDPFGLRTEQGLMFYESGDYGTALEIFEAVLAEESDRWDTRAYAGRAMAYAGRYDEAVGLLTAVMEEEYAKPWLLTARGLAFLGLGDLTAARRDFEAARGEWDDFPDAHLGLLEIALSEGDDLGIYAAANQAFSSAGWDPRVRLMAALAFLVVDRPAEAKGIVEEKGIEVGPDVLRFFKNFAERQPAVTRSFAEGLIENPDSGLADALPEDIRGLFR